MRRRQRNDHILPHVRAYEDGGTEGHESTDFPLGINGTIVLREVLVRRWVGWRGEWAIAGTVTWVEGERETQTFFANKQKTSVVPCQEWEDSTTSQTQKKH